MGYLSLQVTTTLPTSAYFLASSRVYLTKKNVIPGYCDNARILGLKFRGMGITRTLGKTVQLKVLCYHSSKSVQQNIM